MTFSKSSHLIYFSRKLALRLGDTPLESAILALIHAGERDGDAIQQQTDANPAAFNQALTMLEINGLIRPLGGNQWTQQ